MLSPVQLFATPWTRRNLPGSFVHGIFQAIISEWRTLRELPFPSPGNLPDQEIEPASPALAGRFFYHWVTWEAQSKWRKHIKLIVLDKLIHGKACACVRHSGKPRACPGAASKGKCAQEKTLKPSKGWATGLRGGCHWSWWKWGFVHYDVGNDMAYLTNAEYIVRNARLDKAQAVVKISRRNINGLRYTNDTTLMAESEELKSSWWKWKRRVKKLA